jgi:tetratricopeptide (TPR) repeat protein
MRHIIMGKAGVGVWAGLLLGGCLHARPLGWERGQVPVEMPATFDAREELAELVPRAEDAWENRGDPVRLEEALLLMDQQVALQPNAATYVRLARGHHFRAETVLGPDNAPSADRRAAYARGLDAAEKALAMQAPELVSAVRHHAVWETALQKAPEAAAPALYWYALNLARWAELDSPLSVLRNRDRVLSSLRRSMELDPHYNLAGAHRYFGTYYAVALPLAGRNLERAQRHFHQSLSRAPMAFSTKVLMAEHLATAQGDRKLFERLLKDVLESEPGIIPDMVPEQAVEKAKAAALLRKANQLF